MKCWLTFALILAFTQQPTEMPENHGATEHNRAEGAGKTKRGTSNEQTAKPTSNPYLSPASYAGTPASNNDTAADDKKATEENLNTQRKLTLFTGGLLIVGFLQFLALIGQVCIYCRQAKIMGKQAHEMKRQRSYMRLQWKSIGEQAVLMERQLEEIQKAGVQTSRQLEIAEKNVAAMEGQLKEMQSAGKQTAELIAHSNRSIKLEQRAWIQTTNPTLVTANADNPIRGAVVFRNGGRTPAVKVKAFCSVISLNTGASVYGALKQPAHINPIIASQGGDEVEIPETNISAQNWGDVLAGNIVYFILGTITYDDIFDVHHWTHFCYFIDKDGSAKTHTEHNEIDNREENPTKTATSRQRPPSGEAN